MFQEESGETLGGDRNRGSMWLCPLCQESQPDRENLSFHLSDKHSVLPACLDKLLDIVSIFPKVDFTFRKELYCVIVGLSIFLIHLYDALSVAAQFWLVSINHTA